MPAAAGDPHVDGRRRRHRARASSSSAELGPAAHPRVEDAVAAGELTFDLEVHGKEGAPGVFAAELCYPGQINLWSGSMFGVNGIEPGDLTGPRS